MTSRKQSIADESEKLCGGLADMGCKFHWEADNRGGVNSRYVFVRRPVVAKIRVSDHKSDRTERDKRKSRTLVLDVGPHALSWQDALAEIRTAGGWCSRCGAPPMDGKYYGWAGQRLCEQSWSGDPAHRPACPLRGK